MVRGSEVFQELEGMVRRIISPYGHLSIIYVLRCRVGTEKTRCLWGMCFGWGRALL